MSSTPRLVTKPDELESLVDTLLAEPEYALDTEFLRERTYHPELALVQLAWPRGIALVDPLATSPRPLARLFEGRGLAVLHAATQDLEILAHRCGGIPSRVFDTQVAAAFLGHGIASLATLMRAVLGREISKSEQLSDWTRRPLSPSALAYAASDVAHLIELADALRAMLERRGRLAWVEEECERQRARELAPRDPETAWWKLKGKSNLPAKGQAVAQAVAAFREREAERRNVLPRFVLPDLVLMGIAQRAPTSLDELRKVRGLDASHVAGELGRAILEAVRAGLEMPASSRRVPPRGEPEVPTPLVALGMAWLASRAAEEGVEPSMIATRDEVETFLAGGRDVRLATGFRHELVGADLERIARGEVAVGWSPRGTLELVRRTAS